MKNSAYAALLLLTLAATLLLAASCLATVPKPSVPEFTIKLVDASSPETVTYQVNPYTGETESHTRIALYDLKMHIIVKNQPYPGTVDGNTTELQYNVRVKGHFSEAWEPLGVESASPQTAPPDGSGTTELVLPAGQFVSGAQVDVQVEAVSGSNLAMYGFESQSSGWSSTQTVIIPEITWPYGANASPTPIVTPLNPTATPVEISGTNDEGSLPVNADYGLDQTVFVAAAIAGVAATTAAGILLLYLKSKPKKHPVA
jgi:hypothetical protein